MWLHHKENVSLLHVPIINNVFYSLSLKMQKSHHILIHISMFAISVATLTILSSENLILRNFANLWHIQTADFKKLLHKIKILIHCRLRINAVIIPCSVFVMFTTIYKFIND